MASLKRQARSLRTERGQAYFHGRKIMASLKREIEQALCTAGTEFPWSKDHGLIEAGLA